MASEIPLHLPIPLDVLDEAVEWLMRFQAGEVDVAEQEKFESWLKAHHLHLAAWQRAEKVMHAFSETPSTVGRHALSRLSPASITKNRASRLLGITMAIMPILNFLCRGDVGDI